MHRSGCADLPASAVGLVPALQSTQPELTGARRSESTPPAARPVNSSGAMSYHRPAHDCDNARAARRGGFFHSFRQRRSVDPGSGREPAAILTFVTPVPVHGRDEARVHGSTCRLDSPPRAARPRGGRRDQQAAPTSAQHQLERLFNVDGVEPQPGHGAFIADLAEVDPGFVDAASIEVLDGRNHGPSPVLVAVHAITDRRGETPTDPARAALALLTVGRGLDTDLWVLQTQMDRHFALMSLRRQLSALAPPAFGVLRTDIGRGRPPRRGRVQGRMREIGARMALGGDGPRVVRQLVAGGPQAGPLPRRPARLARAARALPVVSNAVG